MIIDETTMMEDEWLEADGLGGFASGTVSGIRTRRYHAVLLSATQPPTGRFVLVNGFDAVLETANGIYPLSSQCYGPNVIHPDGVRHIAGFNCEPWPKWSFVMEDGAKIEHEIFAVHGAPITVLSWRLVDPRAKALLTVRPFLSGRDYHALHHENSAFRFDPEIDGRRVIWHPYPDIPKIIAAHNGGYHHQPNWYRNFIYEQEQERGLDFTEDLAAPGSFEFDLTAGPAVLIFAAQDFTGSEIARERSVKTLFMKLRAREVNRRSAFGAPLDRAADCYLVRRGAGKTIVAGYPWFTDWGRDTFISLRGLCIATDRLDDTRDILIEWASVVSEGMLPNLFPDRGDQPEYNSADASLWYILAVHDFLAAAKDCHLRLSQSQRKTLKQAVDAILTGYAQGTRYAIHMDRDGLLAAGEPGSQLTWMDAKIGDWVVTPRIGKPVELQALWLNGLWIGSQFDHRWREPLARCLQSFRSRFWNAQAGYLHDVIDVDHESGKLDTSFRPNQIFAVGGLPLQIIDGDQAKQVVDAVEQRLWTPLGLRSLAPGENGYIAQYRGGVRERDASYHQGTVWPWLMGPFVEAWLRVHGRTEDTMTEARARFLAPLLEHLDHAGLGHVSEIADAEPPHTPRGCPFQAWSLAELIRLDRVVLSQNSTEAEQRSATR